MESSDVFERTEEWARTIRAALDAPPNADAAVNDDPELAMPQTPGRHGVQAQAPAPAADTPTLTPSRTRIVIKPESVTESVATLESIHTPSTLTTLESTFEATLHARAMRAAGAGVGGGATTAALKASAAFALGRGYDDDTAAYTRRDRLRDGLAHRNALLRGVEGSRRRRRWENDHLRDVPNAQMPLPSDWLARPTHPVHLNVPYHVAQYWDRGLGHYVNEARAAAAVVRRHQIIAQQAGLAVEKVSPWGRSKPPPKKMLRGPESVISVATSDTGSSAFSTYHVTASTVGQVTRQLRTAAKRTPAVKLWVRALEEPIRQYVESESMRLRDLHSDAQSEDAQSDNGAALSANGAGSEFSIHSDSDDEVVFVGRRVLAQKQGTSVAAADETAAADDDDTASDTTISPTTTEGIVFDDLGEGARGSFKRWLAHSLSDYYGLASTSSTVVDTPGKPGNRVVYVSLRDEATQPDAGPILIPRPMWELFDQ